MEWGMIYFMLVMNGMHRCAMDWELIGVVIAKFSRTVLDNL